ncbi:uncharacterized protein Dana_GF26645 [Drosophila ananassae]|uniref:Gustatory receptor n=1 Tax=Drosophila ananassae TaxID=7217 RepID=A0A0P8ZGY7_DROAN|nr:uncharacterized protein Dana_GF26645 [Drosophila ananassae]
MRNLVNFTLRSIVYGSWILGVFPFTINSGNNQIIYLKSLQIYGLLLNFGLLAVAVSTYQEKCYFDRCVLFKGLCIVLQILSILLLNFGFPQESSNIWSTLNIWFYLAILTGALLTMAHFHIALLYIYQFIWSINQQILECIDHLELGQRPDPEEVLVSLRLFSRLLHVKDKLSSIYEVETTLEIAIVFFYNIVNVFDLWLGIMICDHFESECRKSSKILRLFSDFSDLDKDLERIVEEFALFCSHCPIRIRLFGLFDVNYKMGFGVINTNFLYMLFLAQFDYRNMRLK